MELNEPDNNPSQNMLRLIEQLIIEKHYDGIPLLLQDKNKCKLLRNVYSGILDICKKYLSDEYYENNMSLYMCCEMLLKTIAEYGCSDEILLELLEMIETTPSDNVFTSVLKALQICLLRKRKKKLRSFEWSLNSIYNYLTNLPVSDILNNGYDEKQEKLLEIDEKVHRILTNYVTLKLFYEPIIDDIVKSSKVKKKFIDTTKTRKNMLTCFLFQILDRPLSLLSLSGNFETSISYAFQCAQTFVQDICTLFPDPFYFLSLVEKRVRWKVKNSEDYMCGSSCKNIFLFEEKVPLESLGIFYYLLLREKLIRNIKAPKIYNSLYIFETCLYLVVELLQCTEPSIHYKGILLGIQIIDNMFCNEIPSVSLELKIHIDFCKILIKIIAYSENERNRIFGVRLLKKYIFQFDNDGKFYILKNLMKLITHSSLAGYIFILYKNVIAQIFEEKNDLPEYFKGNEFKKIMLNRICYLEEDEKTNLIEKSDHIVSALNVLRYFLMADIQNKTGIFDFYEDIKYKFLIPLRKAIDLSRAHFKVEEYRLRNDEDNSDDLSYIFESLSTDLPKLTNERKLELIAGAMVAFDLIESLLVRVNECIEK